MSILAAPALRSSAANGGRKESQKTSVRKRRMSSLVLRCFWSLFVKTSEASETSEVLRPVRTRFLRGGAGDRFDGDGRHCSAVIQVDVLHSIVAVVIAGPRDIVILHE